MGVALRFLWLMRLMPFLKFLRDDFRESFRRRMLSPFSRGSVSPGSIPIGFLISIGMTDRTVIPPEGVREDQAPPGGVPAEPGGVLDPVL